MRLMKALLRLEDKSTGKLTPACLRSFVFGEEGHHDATSSDPFVLFVCMIIHTLMHGTFVVLDVLTVKASSPMNTRAAVWDRVGVSLSGICVAHCLALPVLLASVPLWPFADRLHAWLHPVFAVLLVPTTAAAAWYGWREHRQQPVLWLFGAGLMVILAAGAVGHDVPGGTVETSLTLAGSALLVTGHWRNWRTCRQCRMATQPL